MANKTISDFPAVTVVGKTDIYHVRQGLTDSNVTVEKITEHHFRLSDYGTNDTSINTNTVVSNTLKTMIEVFRTNTSGGDLTLTLQAMAATVSPGMMILAYNETGANNLTVIYDTDEESILQPGAFQHFIWTGADWKIIEAVYLNPIANTTYNAFKAGKTFLLGDPAGSTLSLDIQAGAVQVGSTCFVKNADSTDDISLVLSASRTLTLQPGEFLEVEWDGTSWVLLTPLVEAPIGDVTYTAFDSTEVNILGDPNGATLNLDIQAGALVRGTRCLVKNMDSTDDIALTISVSDTLTLTPGQIYEFVWDGSVWTAIVTPLITNFLTVTDDYTITDTDLDGFEELVIYANTINKKITVTLPTLADNQQKKISFIMVSDGGMGSLKGESSETISGLNTQNFYMQYNYVKVIAQSSEWQIINKKQTLEGGWVNTNDWTNRHFGFPVITYSGASGSFVVGELITESVSGNTWRVLADTGTALTCRRVSGTGHAVNGRILTGSTSTETATVNGSTKNNDSNVGHNFDYDIKNLSCKFLFSTTGTEDDSQDITTFVNRDGGNEYNTYPRQVSSNSFQLQGGGNGGVYFDAAGQGVILASQDYYYNIIIEVL